MSDQNYENTIFQLDEQVAELMAENWRLRKAIETHRESFHGGSGGLSDDDILWAVLEVSDD